MQAPLLFEALGIAMSLSSCAFDESRDYRIHLTGLISRGVIGHHPAHSKKLSEYSRLSCQVPLVASFDCSHASLTKES